MANKVEFDYYIDHKGKSEFLSFIEKLPKKDREKLLSMIEKIEQHGLVTAAKMEWIKKIDKEIFEIRSKISSNIQRVLYFHEVDNRFIITHGFTKKTQKTPQREIQRAKSIRRNYLNEIERRN